MHPWKKIIKGNTKEVKTKACFICLERIPCSDDEIELKVHLLKIHSANVHYKELVEMCTEAEEREERKGWSSINDILVEEMERKEAEERKRAESGGCMAMFRKKKMYDHLDNNDEIDCLLCQEYVQSCEYDKHLEKLHGVIFCVKEIKKAREKCKGFPLVEEPGHETEMKETRTDADTVKELVEMKYLTKRRKI